MALNFVVTKNASPDVYTNLSGDFRPVKLKLRNLGPGGIDLRDPDGHGASLKSGEARAFTYDGKNTTLTARLVAGSGEFALLELD